MDKYIERLLKIEQRIYKRGIEIQNQYGFKIPDYVLYEIVKSEKDKNIVDYCLLCYAVWGRSHYGGFTEKSVFRFGK